MVEEEARPGCCIFFSLAVSSFTNVSLVNMNARWFVVSKVLATRAVWGSRSIATRSRYDGGTRTRTASFTARVSTLAPA